MNFKKQLQEYGDVIENQEMKFHTSFRIGGRVHYSFYPFNLESLKEGVKFLKEQKVPYRVVGRGSNILWCDEDLDMVVIFLDHYLCNFEIEDNEIIDVEAGCALIGLATQAKNNELSGLEFASGIPGSVGGAIYMNAGAYKKEMKDIVREVLVLKDDEYVWMNVLDCEFAYRTSIFRKHPDWIVVKARIQMERGDKETIEEVMNSRRERRMETQPLDKPSCGSTFKNPEEMPSWKAIEECGLRGYRVGGAMVSDKHCNFVVNVDNATSEDVRSIIKHVQEAVKEKFNIDLTCEVEIICQEIRKKN